MNTSYKQPCPVFGPLVIDKGLVHGARPYLNVSNAENMRAVPFAGLTRAAALGATTRRCQSPMGVTRAEACVVEESLLFLSGLAVTRICWATQSLFAGPETLAKCLHRACQLKKALLPLHSANNANHSLMRTWALQGLLAGAKDGRVGGLCSQVRGHDEGRIAQWREGRVGGGCPTRGGCPAVAGFSARRGAVSGDGH